MGQDEYAQPLVRRADFCRAEQTRRRRVVHSPKLSQDGFETEADVTCDVFKEDPFGGAFPDDAGNLGPEVAGIIHPAAFSGGAEGLARIPGEDDVEGPLEGPGIEAAQIVPDWSRGEVSGALGGNEDVSGIALPFDKSAGVKSGFGEHDTQIQASAARAERQSMPGT